MKKFLKSALRLATLAAVIPVKVSHDNESGKTTYQSLLLSLDVTPNDTGSGSSVGLNLGDGVLSGAIHNMVSARKEAALFADEELMPASAVEEPIFPTPAVQEEAPAAQEDTVWAELS